MQLAHMQAKSWSALLVFCAGDSISIRQDTDISNNVESPTVPALHRIRFDHVCYGVVLLTSGMGSILGRVSRISTGVNRKSIHLYKYIAYSAILERNHHRIAEERVHSGLTKKRSSASIGSGVGNQLIPKGTTALVLIYYLHRHSRFDKTSTSFTPDKFLCDATRLQQYAYMPFLADEETALKSLLKHEKIVMTSRRIEVVTKELKTSLAELSTTRNMSASAAVHYVLIVGKLVAAIGLAIIIYLCAKLTCQWIRMYYYLRHVPRVKERWPFSLLLDTWMALRKMDRNLPITAKFFNYLEDITSKVYEQDVAMAYYGPQPFLLGVSPTVFEAILSSNVNLNKSFIYRMMKPWMGNGVLTSDREIWRTRRKILTPAFHFKILDNYVHIMNRRTKEVIDKLMQLGEKPFDILPILRLAAFGMLFETAMGVNINEEEVTNKKLLHTNDDLAASIISRVLKVFHWSDTLYYMTEEGKSFLKKARYIREYNEKIIQQRKAQYISGEAGCGSRKSFLDILLHMHIDEKTLTEQEVAEEVATFFIGGFDTTATATSYTLYLLGHNSDIQGKVHAEIDAIFANDKQRSVTAEDIKKLKYLECVIKESLRLYPPVPLVARNIDEDMHIGKYTIPKGTVAACAIYFLHRHPKAYKNPNTFMPERFMDNRNVSPFAFVPFSAGSRNCIGQRFAQLEEKIMLTHILRNFRVESLVRKEELQLQLEIVLRPLQGIQLKLTPR